MNTDRRPGSRMPDDPAYWRGLAARSIDAALEPDAAVPGEAAPWWQGLSDAAFMLAASALLALLGGTQLVEERQPVTATQTHALTNAIVPEVDLLSTLMNADEPPPAMAMLRVVARREVAR